MKDAYRLSVLSRANLNLFVARRYIDANLRSKLEKLIDLRGKIGTIDTKLKALGTEHGEISSDQSRLRENIKILATTTTAKQLIARYVQKVNDQETRIEQMKIERQNLHSEKQRIVVELEQEIKKFDIDGNRTQGN